MKEKERLPKINCECEGDCYCAENFAQSEYWKNKAERGESIFLTT